MGWEGATRQEVSTTVVIGLGNPFRGDEGVGPRLVQQLSQQMCPNDTVRFFDLGTAGMRLLDAIAGVRKVVVVDCALMGLPPGTLRRFVPEQVKSLKSLGGFSIHDTDLMQILALSKQLGESPEQVVLFGIQPENLNYTMELSSILTQHWETYVAAIAQELVTETEERG